MWWRVCSPRNQSVDPVGKRLRRDVLNVRENGTVTGKTPLVSLERGQGAGGGTCVLPLSVWSESNVAYVWFTQTITSDSIAVWWVFAGNVRWDTGLNTRKPVSSWLRLQRRSRRTWTSTAKRETAELVTDARCGSWGSERWEEQRNTKQLSSKPL